MIYARSATAYNSCSDSTSDVAMIKVNLKEIRKNLKKEEKMKLPCINAIYNGNCTEWSAIWSEIKRVIDARHDIKIMKIM